MGMVISPRRALLSLGLLLIAVSRVDAQARGNTTRGNATRGLALLSAFGDSLPAHRGNDLRCVSCHLENGTRGRAMSWVGTASRYPRYRSRPGTAESLAQRINECIARSLARRMLNEESREMRDMIAYIASLDAKPRPPAVDTVKLVGNVARGGAGYAATCARCHGADGQGMKAIAPAVWGAGSYSIGAGLARQTMLATFLRHNMPFDGVEALSPQRAADIAAFVLTKARQDHPGKERDWPKGDPPADVAYTTTAARKAGLSTPAPRPLLRRRVSPDSLSR